MGHSARHIVKEELLALLLCPLHPALRSEGELLARLDVSLADACGLGSIPLNSRIYGWARETGTICQIDVSTGKRCFFWARRGSFSAISHYVFNECCPNTVFFSIAIFLVRNRRKWPLLCPKNAPFCCRNANLTNGPLFTHIRGGAVGAKLGDILWDFQAQPGNSLVHCPAC